MNDKFLSAQPIVRIEKSFTNPFKNAMAAARTCYSGKGVMRDEEVDLTRYDGLAKSIYEAGHHTVFTHAYFQFEISNVSRFLVWSFLHSHPFYNSEQISQRYIEVREGNCAIPPLNGEALSIYLGTIKYQIEAYRKLIEMLLPLCESEYLRLFPVRRIHVEQCKAEVRRKAQEIARYVLPIAVFAYMYHTVSSITLLRYNRLCQQYDVPLEQRIVVSKMIDELLGLDPSYRIIMEKAIDLDETPECEFFSTHRDVLASKQTRSFLREFDDGQEGKVSKLVDFKVNNEIVLARSVLEVLGVTADVISDDEAIELALNPARNGLLSESLVLTTHSKIGRTLHHPSYTLRKKLSHAADSQDQRHRMTPASLPCLHSHYCDDPDYIVPELLKQDESVLEV
jgi:thymidylate synthase ThyX